jgi:hypothetical protein
MTEGPSRTKFLGWLAAFVVLCGAASWLVTWRIGMHEGQSTPSRPQVVVAVPTPPDCAVDELSVVGVFDECATKSTSLAATCTSTYQWIDYNLWFAGDRQDFGLEIEIYGDFIGPGKYDLRPWPHAMDTRDGVPKVQVDEYRMDTTWQSVSGVLTVTNSSGLSGTVSATLQASNVSAAPSVPPSTLTVSGPWSCP